MCQSELEQWLFKVCDIGEKFGEEDGDAPDALAVDRYLDGLVSSYFDRGDDNTIVALGAVFLELDAMESV